MDCLNYKATSNINNCARVKGKPNGGILLRDVLHVIMFVFVFNFGHECYDIHALKLATSEGSMRDVTLRTVCPF